MPEGQAFLKGERRQLKRWLEERETSGDVTAALGSIEEWLGNPEEAVQYLKLSVEMEPHSVYFTLVCWFAFTLLGAFPKGYCDWLYELLCFSLPFDIFTFPYTRIPRALFFFLSF